MFSVIFDGLLKYCGPTWLFGIVLFTLVIGEM